MKKYLFYVFIAMYAGFFWDCSNALQVTTDYDKKVDFSKYKTFALDTVRLSEAMGGLTRQRIVDAVVSSLKSRGFKQAAEPDLLVHITSVLKDKTSVSATSYGYGGYYRPYAWNGVLSSYTTYSVNHYNEGSLIIDIADADSRNLVWEGVGNREIDGPLKDPDEEIPAAVNQILKSFPPVKKSMN